MLNSNPYIKYFKNLGIKGAVEFTEWKDFLDMQY